MIELFGIGVPRAPHGWLLDEVSATIEGGQFVVVVGSRSEERQALLDVVTARLVPPRGRLWVDRVALMADTAARVRDMVAAVDPDEELAPQRSVLRNALTRHPPLRRLGRLLTLPRRDERDALEAALASVGLEGRAHEPAFALTRADRARVLVARALAGRARHIVVRELDRTLAPPETIPILVLLRSLARSERRVVMVSLAERTLASSLADRFLVLSDGRLAHDDDDLPSPLPTPDRRLKLVTP